MSTSFEQSEKVSSPKSESEAGRVMAESCEFRIEPEAVILMPLGISYSPVTVGGM